MIENLLKTLAVQYPTYGFEKLFNWIRLKNYIFNHKCVYRIYYDLKLNLKIKPKRKIGAKNKNKISSTRKKPMLVVGFYEYALMNGRRIRTANVIVDCNRCALGTLVSYSLT